MDFWRWSLLVMSASLLWSCESILGDLDKDDVDDEEEEEIVEWGTALLEELIIRGTGITSIDLRHNPLLRVVDSESTSLKYIYLLPEQQIEDFKYDASKVTIYREEIGA